MISCNEHDYIEIACMYQYPIKITMLTGEVIECTAVDTHYNSSREECIIVTVNGVDSALVVSNFSKMEVCIENPYFKEISFA